MRNIFFFLSCTLSISFSLASAPAQDWESVVATLRSTLDVLQLSHERHLAQGASRHVKKDSTFRTGPAGYWHPLASRQRLDPSEGFSDQVKDLINEIGGAVQQLLELLASQVTIGGPLSGAAVSLIPTSTPSRPSILPITNIITPPAVPTSYAAATTSRSLVPDSPIYSSNRPSPSAARSTFDPQATNLNVVYYSQTDLTPVISLTQVCNDPSIDIVILAFVTHLVSNGGYPSMNMASNCWAPNTAQQAAGATGLLDCVGDGLASKIAQCQQQGKKVMLSLGGSVGDLSMSSDSQAVQVANTLWNLFLGGTNTTLAPLRPYGSVVLDGIDIGKFLFCCVCCQLAD